MHCYYVVYIQQYGRVSPLHIDPCGRPVVIPHAKPVFKTFQINLSSKHPATSHLSLVVNSGGGYGILTAKHGDLGGAFVDDAAKDIPLLARRNAETSAAPETTP